MKPHSADRSGLREDLREAIGRVIDAEILAGFVPHGNARWSPRSLAACLLLWAFGEGGLVERFGRARRVAAELFPGEVVPLSYQGFVPLLAAHTARLLVAVFACLRARIASAPAEFFRLGQWIVFAADGTRVEVPRSAANEAHFAPAKSKGKTAGKTAARPQIWLTVLWHVGLGLPWAFRHGPTGASEKAHLLEMLGELPPGSLLAMDAGFTGYDFWQSVLEAGHSFLVRAGANVRLLRAEAVRAGGRLRRRGDLVLLWPERARRRGQEPLVLRLIRLHDGRREMALVTNVLDRKALSGRQAALIYRRRWGVEVFLRTLKQTFGRGRLRSLAPRNAERELAWSLAALGAVQWLGAEQLMGAGQNPVRLSTAGAIRVLRAALDALLGGALDLFASLAILGDDGYRRTDKSSRDYPRKKRSPPPSPPQIRHMTREENRAYLQLITC